ncbi:MAG: HAD-IA family hydrolase [Bacteroidales bacterium]|nr:HAD-IA family hydrolase [Bacteroidales bacterium]
MTIIFDLDGTLINTIADLGLACNHALACAGYPTHELAEYPHLVGNGVNKLIERALPASAKQDKQQTEAEIQRLRKDFIPYYNAHNCDHTVPYEGMKEVLATLKQRGAKLAVASNKYQEATRKIIDHYFPSTFDVVFGEREGVPRKPDPQVVHDILALLPDEKVVYVGDSLVDIATARNAGLPVIACSWGFVSREELAAAKPDYLIDTTREILNYTL